LEGTTKLWLLPLSASLPLEGITHRAPWHSINTPPPLLVRASPALAPLPAQEQRYSLAIYAGLASGGAPCRCAEARAEGDRGAGDGREEERLSFRTIESAVPFYRFQPYQDQVEHEPMCERPRAHPGPSLPPPSPPGSSP
jgi:hypothetical protein